jgi:hypothetical protein
MKAEMADFFPLPPFAASTIPEDNLFTSFQR